ncbi:MAG: hypothetical protein BroJett040_13440 [Oligoflexia bacterium]|nr:MAG: hypothetical protein BroJett040_13440 [Oligoflexia bacterium]
MGEFSLTHILLFSIILLIFFGPSKLPQLGQSLGKAIKGFKQGLNEIDAEATPIKDQQANQAQLKAGSAEQKTQTEHEKETHKS